MFFEKRTLIITTLLITMIIFIPTMIVIFPISQAEQPHETEQVISVSNEVPQDEAITVPVMRTETNKVETVPLEKYVIGVVASEMPAEFELEALKAQALAARTFVVNQLMNSRDDEEVTVLDTVDHQVYNDENELRNIFGSDFHWKLEKVEQAVLETESEILTYEDRPITPAFFSTSNGYTENSEDYWESELPYLRSVTSKWDEQSPKFLSQHTFTIEEMETLLNITLQRDVSIPIELNRTESNRVKSFIIADNTFTGRQIRERLSLPSNDFSIEQRHDHFIFTTKGYGHGVGMSQYGADGMAKEGKSYKEIVSYYYKDVSISNLTDIAPLFAMK